MLLIRMVVFLAKMIKKKQGGRKLVLWDIGCPIRGHCTRLEQNAKSLTCKQSNRSNRDAMASVRPGPIDFAARALRWYAHMNVHVHHWR